MQLGNLLDLSKKLLDKIWEIIREILLDRANLSIFRDRCLDQVIMCTFYAILKVQKKSVKFNVIIQRYQEIFILDQKQFNEMVYFIASGSKVVDIIYFYNQVYIRKFKKLILKQVKMHSNKLQMFKKKHGKRGAKSELVESGGAGEVAWMQDLKSTPFTFYNKHLPDPMDKLKSPTSGMMKMKRGAFPKKSNKILQFNQFIISNSETTINKENQEKAKNRL